MTERQWQRRTLIADIAYMEGNVTAYRSNGAYYYFRDGVLVKIDQGVIPAQKIEMEVRAEQKVYDLGPSDLHAELRKLDELRKDGVITDDEFQAEKKKILENSR